MTRRRLPKLGERAAVASAHPLATTAGLEAMAAGGNAYDAALAISATLPVVQPHMNGLGSDFFAVVRDRTTFAVNSNGPAGRRVSRELFARAGAHTIPTRGALSAITVPGLVAAWTFLAAHGSRDFRQNLGPAIRLAERGFPVSRAAALAARAALSYGDPDFRAVYGGARPGGLLRQVGMGRTLREVAEDGGHGFYHGALARRICRDLRTKGGVLEPADFDEFSPRLLPPLRIRYRNYAVETNPPPSQGATELFWLAELARSDLASLSEREYVAKLVETMYPAYEFRRRFVGDPTVVRLPRDWLRAASGGSRPFLAGPEGRSDTTAFSVWDGSVGVSAIQSNYMGFGSGVSIRRAGINLNNRGSYFSLDPGHPNCLAPGKQTFHTLMATLARGPRTVLLGSMGGDVQPQVNVQVLTRHLDRAASVTSAIAAPRFAYPATVYSSARLYREPGLALRSGRPLAHDPDLFGHAQAISVGENLEVGIDPRGDGLLPLPS